MSTDKGGSDLDVFKDLKPQTPDGKPISDNKKTLMGIAVPEGTLPAVPGSRSIPPPAPSQRNVGAPPSPPPPAASQEASLDPAGEGANDSSGAKAPAAGDTGPAVVEKSKPAAASPDSRSSRLGLDSWSTTQPSAPHNPAARPAKPAAAAPGDDIGWDDDDDKTQIYDKDTQSAAQSLLQPASGGYATLPGGRPPPPMSRPPGTLSPPTGPGYGGRSTAPPATATSNQAPLPPGMPAQHSAGISPKVLYPLVIVIAALIGLAIYALLPKKGNLTVTVAGGVGNKALSAVEVYLDERLRCKVSPCEIPRIKPGTHYVEIRAAGYQSTAKRAVSIPEGDTAVINEQLMRSGTGIRVFGDSDHTGMLLRVDGNEFGPLPQVLREMDPGEHVVEVVSSGPKKRYRTHQERVIVEPNLMTSIGPVRLKVLKGLATIRAGEGAEGAEVTLRVGDSRRGLPALPVRLEIETREKHILIARKKGFAQYEEEIVFEDGHAERTFEITLTGRSVSVPQRRKTAAPRPSTGTTPRSGRPAKAKLATLNINSTPPSNVLLDGKPLGSTPLRGVQVSPGSHRVIFINGSERKPVSVTAIAGKTEKVSVKF